MLELLYNIIHIGVLIFVILVPLFGSIPLLLVNAMLIPLILIHWICNDNSCAFVIIEYKIRNIIYNRDILRNECISANIVDPIYNFSNYFNNANIKILLCITMAILWLINIYKILFKLNKIQLSTK